VKSKEARMLCGGISVILDGPRAGQNDRAAASFALKLGITLAHLTERDESLLTFVPQHQPHAPETPD
jgi:hypothetical protein